MRRGRRSASSTAPGTPQTRLAEQYGIAQSHISAMCARDGTNNFDNMVAACGPCNSRRGARVGNRPRAEREGRILRAPRRAFVVGAGLPWGSLGFRYGDASSRRGRTRSARVSLDSPRRTGVRPVSWRSRDRRQVSRGPRRSKNADESRESSRAAARVSRTSAPSAPAAARPARRCGPKLGPLGSMTGDQLGLGLGVMVRDIGAGRPAARTCAWLRLQQGLLDSDRLRTPSEAV